MYIYIIVSLPPSPSLSLPLSLSLYRHETLKFLLRDCVSDWSWWETIVIARQELGPTGALKLPEKSDNLFHNTLRNTETVLENIRNLILMCGGDISLEEEEKAGSNEDLDLYDNSDFPVPNFSSNLSDTGADLSIDNAENLSVNSLADHIGILPL